MSQVSIVIVSWNSRPMLQRCLQSLAGSPIEIIVVDNASADGSADLVARDFPAITLIRASENLGFAGAANRGWRTAQGEFVLILNPDVEVPPGAVECLARFLETHPGYGAAAGRLVDADGRFQRGFSVRRFPTLASIAMDLLLVDAVWPANPATRHYLALDVDDRLTQAVEQPAAACLMVRREILARIDGLDEGFYPAWFEDVDLCRRIAATGRSIAFVADATFPHEGGGAMRALGLTRFSRIWYTNLRRYVGKHHGPATLLALRLLIVVGMVERMAISLVTGRADRIGAYARVLVDTLQRATAAGQVS